MTVHDDPWDELRRHTPARIALGRSGVALPTAELLRFAAAHAAARDAVHTPLDVPALLDALRGHGLPAAIACVASRAATRGVYLRRPDLGRRLHDDASLPTAAAPTDLVLVLADGLSATAVQRHAPPLVAALRAAWDAALPVVVATQARVALGDEIGARLNARMVLVLIGERPGLSSPDSLGAYLTFDPRVGRSDAQRNCVSNIRPDGLPPHAAALRIGWLLRESLRRRLSGVALKDDSAVEALSPTGAVDRLPDGA